MVVEGRGALECSIHDSGTRSRAAMKAREAAAKERPEANWEEFRPRMMRTSCKTVKPIARAYTTMKKASVSDIYSHTMMH
jgi:hypothetical protein